MNPFIRLRIFGQLDREYLIAAFNEGKRCGAMQDGHYHPEQDLEFVLMYCGY